MIQSRVKQRLFQSTGPSIEPASHAFRAYGVAVLSVLISIVVRFALNPFLGDHDAYTAFFPAVAVSVFFGRARGGLLAIFLSTLAADYLFVPPQYTFGTKGLTDATSLVVFLVGAGIVTGFGEAMHRARARATELRRSTHSFEEQARQIVETAHEGIWMVDTEGKIVMVNARLCEMLGYTSEEMLGRHKWDFLFPEDVAAAKELFERRRRGIPDQADYRFRTKDGKRVWTLMAARPRFDTQGQFCGALDMFSDITERKRAEEQVAKFVLLVENSDEFIGISDLEGRVGYLNPAGRQMVGTAAAPGELSIYDFFFPEDQAFVRAKFLPRLLAEGHGEVEIRFRHFQTGQPLWVLHSVLLLRDAKGRPSGLATITKNITERKVAEDALRNSETTLRMAQKAGGIGVLDWDMATRQARCSETFFEIVGQAGRTGMITEEEWLGMLHPDDRKAVIEHLHGQDPCQAEYRIVRADGQVRWLNYIGQLVVSASGNPAHLIGTVRDITEAKLRQKQLESMVAERTGQLREMVQELEVFSYSIAHDMRAPLRAMQGLSRAVIEDFGTLLPEEGREHLHRIAASANRLDRQILDVLSYSYLVRGQLPLDNIDLNSLLLEIVSSYPDLQAAQASFEIEGNLPVAQANRAALTQVISNLLSNAVKFVNPGTTPKVRIWSERENGFVRLHFKDNGIGIPAKSQQKIFGIFQRLHPADVYDGTGIGLAIVKKAIGRMGGQVGVISEVGRGSEFWFTLKAAAAAPIEAESETARWAA